MSAVSGGYSLIILLTHARQPGIFSNAFHTKKKRQKMTRFMHSDSVPIDMYDTSIQVILYFYYFF